MLFDRARCQALLCEGVLAGLEAGSERIREAGGCFSALSLDLVPWHGYVGLSLRRGDDLFEGGEWRRYLPAEWRHHAFVGCTTEGDSGGSAIEAPALQPAVCFIHEAYLAEESPNGLRAEELAHLIFLAGA